MLLHRRSLLSLIALLLLGGCASRPVNPPIAQVDRDGGYRFQTRQAHDGDKENLVILAFSGGGTRAAAFSYGVLEELRQTQLVTREGKTVRLLDEVDVITGVSGGSFTALAYGLYGDRLFDEYEKRFLKRDVQGELLARFLNPTNWTALWSNSWGRSEMAAQMYDEILFNGATFGDLDRGTGPLIMATATDISTGSRFTFVQSEFDIICSDLNAVPLSRAAASSSAVPMVLSPVTFNNYGGTCSYKFPSWAQILLDPAKTVRPAGRSVQRLKELQGMQDGANRPYLHLVDGGISDNLGMRGVLESLEEAEAVRGMRRKTRFDDVRRLIVFVVNSLSVPKTNWDKSERPPNDLLILLKATGVPIDRNSYEAVELLKDIVARWKVLRQVRDSEEFRIGASGNLKVMADVPDIEIYPIDVSFQALDDAAEFEYLNDLPTSFVLSDEAVDRLRAAAGKIIAASPEFKRLLKDTGARVVPASGAAVPPPR
ncbi:MAG TPA: patatin-like phospholipase family protein [Casimicrobiaceae bacterium]|nr:patatin-like phospholipase family protein [Casimicrobiaceae bacterium]